MGQEREKLSTIIIIIILCVARCILRTMNNGENKELNQGWIIQSQSVIR
jgi:hypothetical protein